MAKPLGRAGFFSIITTFFLVVIIVAALVGFIAVYSSIFKINAGSLQRSEKTIDAQLFKNSFMMCQGGPYLLEDALNQDKCGLSPGVSGYSVIQKSSFGCTPKAFSKGDTTSASLLRFPYQVAVLQKDSTDMCLATLTIYV